MELSPANQAALLLRFNAVFPGAVFPGWAGLNLTQQQVWKQQDPEAAAVASGELTAEQHASLLTDGLSPEVPQVVDPRIEYQRQMDAALARLNEETAQMAARNAERASAIGRHQDASIGRYS